MFQARISNAFTDHRFLIGILYVAVAYLIYTHTSCVKISSQTVSQDIINHHVDAISDKIFLKLRGLQSSPQSSSNPLNLAPVLQTYPESCKAHKVYGNDHHGGWVVCDDDLVNRSAERCVVYSYGLGADWSFDKALEGIGCEIHGFDPSGIVFIHSPIAHSPKFLLYICRQKLARWNARC